MAPKIFNKLTKIFKFPPPPRSRCRSPLENCVANNCPSFPLNVLGRLFYYSHSIHIYYLEPCSKSGKNAQKQTYLSSLTWIFVYGATTDRKCWAWQSLIAKETSHVCSDNFFFSTRFKLIHKYQKLFKSPNSKTKQHKTCEKMFICWIFLQIC